MDDDNDDSDDDNGHHGDGRETTACPLEDRGSFITPSQFLSFFRLFYEMLRDAHGYLCYRLVFTSRLTESLLLLVIQIGCSLVPRDHSVNVCDTWDQLR